ncbi:hypothetical protein [Ktedonobacter robiniae]|uniref:DUF3995 domain-containing protein n=1 Tax=Ktedonobacter robiniae TaxID=2778365 RepID=A0ABQ3V486_9CHLR|nr:hypothetical protein [Ktedonobacter robiniae]GHO59782.1 hypothetical protein KSB_82570 [Ktedonobacter robiniae]
MNRGTKQTWRQGILFATMMTGMVIGIIFGILGKNSFDPDRLFWKYPQNNSFLWISTIAFFIAAALSHTTWLLFRVDMARRDILTDKKSAFYMYGKDPRAIKLTYLALFPSISIRWALGNLADISHLEIFLWMEGVVFLVIIVTLTGGMILLFKGYR